MIWPDVLAYTEAIQSPGFCFSDPELKQGQVTADALGLPRPCTGNFAAVYQVRGSDGKIWAVKCFTREVANLQARYLAISAHLRRVKPPPFMVGFEYQDKGILVKGNWYAVLKMGWVEGLELNPFVKRRTTNPEYLNALAEIWLRLAGDLRFKELAHGDLQHGNVLLVPRQGGGVSLRLVDYDGLFVPALAGTRSGEVGHPNFQHPRRRDDPFHAEIDRFSHLVIYTALRSLAVKGQELWDRYDNGDNLLFREEDFKTPSASPLFHELWQVKDPVVRGLTGHLLLACQGSSRAVPVLDDLVGRGKFASMTADQHQRVSQLLGVGASQVRPAPRMAAAAVVLQAPPVRAPLPDPARTVSASQTLVSPRTPAASLPATTFAPPTVRRTGRKRPARKDRRLTLVLAAAAVFFLLVMPLLGLAIFAWNRAPGSRPAAELAVQAEEPPIHLNRPGSSPRQASQPLIGDDRGGPGLIQPGDQDPTAKTELPNGPLPAVRKLFGRGPREYLVHLQEFGVRNGPWEFSKDGSIASGPWRRRIKVSGRPSPHGIGMIPPQASYACLQYRLGRQAARFNSLVAIDDGHDGIASHVIFEVLGDGQSLWESKPVSRHGLSQEVNLDVASIDVLELRVSTPGRPDGLHAVWIEPRLFQKAGMTDEDAIVASAQNLFVHGPREYLAHLEEFGVLDGQWPFSKDGTISPNRIPIKVGDVPSPHGLGLAPPANEKGYAAVKYRLAGKAALFKGAVAINDSADIIFSPGHCAVLGDGKLLWKSSPMQKTRNTQSFEINVEGVEDLELRVGSFGSETGLHMVWIEPRLLQKADTPDDTDGIAAKKKKLFEHGPREYLADLPEFDVKEGPWPFAKDGTIGPDHLGIRVAGIPSPKGLAMHPDNNLVGYAAAKYRLGKKAALFRAVAAINDSSTRILGPALFEVLGDAKSLWVSRKVAKTRVAQEINLSVEGVDVLELRVYAIGSHIGLHAVWMEPRVLQEKDSLDR